MLGGAVGARAEQQRRAAREQRASPRQGGHRREALQPGHLVENTSTAVLRAGWAGLPAPQEAPSLPQLRSGVRGGGARFQVGRGGRGGGVLIEVWRHFKLAARARRLRAGPARGAAGPAGDKPRRPTAPRARAAHRAASGWMCENCRVEGGQGRACCAARGPSPARAALRAAQGRAVLERGPRWAWSGVITEVRIHFQPVAFPRVLVRCSSGVA